MNYVRNVLLAIIGVASVFAAFVLSSPTASSHPNNFPYAIKVVLEHEGGLTNDKHDPGGLTNYGISLRFLKDEHIDINGDGKIDANDIIHLTQTKADDIYFKDFWKKYHYDEIIDKNIATKVFDGAVNMGASRENKLLKKAINLIIYEPIAVDGTLDEETIGIINNIETAVLHDALRKTESDFYKSIVDKNHALIGFEKGWLLRAAW